MLNCYQTNEICHKEAKVYSRFYDQQAISQLRAAASHANDDVGIMTSSGAASIANADANAIVPGRTPAQVSPSAPFRMYRATHWSTLKLGWAPGCDFTAKGRAQSPGSRLPSIISSCNVLKCSRYSVGGTTMVRLMRSLPCVSDHQRGNPGRPTRRGRVLHERLSGRCWQSACLPAWCCA